MQRIKILDSFRGLAASIVVFHHVYTRFYTLYDTQHFKVLHNIFHFISDLNRVAVLFFFILSGFSIRLSLQKGMPVTKALLNDYLFRRFNRILPLYIIAIAATALAGIVVQQLNTADFSLTNLFGNLLFLQTSTSYKGYWFSPYGNNGPLWSLSFEMFYYLFFPFFILCIRKLFRGNFTSAATALYILSAAFLLSLTCIVINKIIFFPYIAFATLFYIWYSGFFIADLYVKKQLHFSAGLGVLIIIMFVTAALQLVVTSASVQMLFSGSVLSIVFYLLFLVKKNFPGRIIVKTENAFNFLFYKIGRGSYALYLFHYPLLLILMWYRVSNIWIVILSMAVLSVLCVAAEEYFVKKRFGFLRVSYFK